MWQQTTVYFRKKSTKIASRKKATGNIQQTLILYTWMNHGGRKLNVDDVSKVSGLIQTVEAFHGH